MEKTLTRAEAVQILTNIANGVVRKIVGKKIAPTEKERRDAARLLAKIDGWNTAPSV